MERPISDGEWEILQALWQADRATASDVARALSESRGWARTTVKTLLGRMVEKGLVRAERLGHVWDYRAALSPAKVRRASTWFV